jgi:hypothetical protein
MQRIWAWASAGLQADIALQCVMVRKKLSQFVFGRPEPRRARFSGAMDVIGFRDLITFRGRLLKFVSRLLQN